jgi:MoxR-like ATPase
MTDPAAKLRDALHLVTQNLVERESLVELVALAAVASEHVLVLGPPGTAKSIAVRRIATAIGGRYFEYLLGCFTEPTEIFGSVNLRKLREGIVETETRGMLPTWLTHALRHRRYAQCTLATRFWRGRRRTA